MPSGRPVRDTDDYEAQEKAVIEKHMDMILEKLYDKMDTNKLARVLTAMTGVVIRSQKIVDIKKAKIDNQK